MLKEALLVLSVFLMGFVEAVPIGATQLEIARRSLNGYLSSALMIVVGSVLSDAMYGVIAFWGVAPFLRNNTVLAIFWMFGAAASAVLGIWAVREGRSNHAATDRSMQLLKKRNLAFMTGFSLAITNPFMIAYWLIGASFLRKAGILQSFQMSDTILLLTAGSLGIASYLVVLAMTVYKVKKFFSDQAIRQITLVFGVVLLILASYFSFRAAKALHDGKEAPEMFGTSAPGRNDYRISNLVDRAPAAAKSFPTADYWRGGYTSFNGVPASWSLSGKHRVIVNIVNGIGRNGT